MVVAQAFNPSNWEAKAVRFLWDQPGLHCEFQDSQGYVKRLSQKTKFLV